MIDLNIYVPAPESTWRHSIKAGSGIVGTYVSELGSRIKIDYEGNVNHAVNITCWKDKLIHAAGRHVVNYPTVARAWVDSDEMIPVGRFTCNDDWTNKTYAIYDSDALVAWAGEDALK